MSSDVRSAGADLPGRSLFGSALATALLMLSACSAEPAPTANAQASTSAAPAIEVAPPPIAAPAPAVEVASADTAEPGKPPASAPQARDTDLVTARRCGWLHNPTPGNWWLFDGHGEWILATQGGEQARGMDDIPEISADQWTETNRHYGYGCACMKVTARPGVLQVVEISSISIKPLKQCRTDPALPRP